MRTPKPEADDDGAELGWARTHRYGTVRIISPRVFTGV